MNRCKSSHILFVFVLILFLSGKMVPAIAQKNFDNSIFDFGFKIGLNALSTTSYEVFLNNEKLNAGNYKNKNGYILSGFARINLGRIFMQPELEWNQYKQEALFALPLSLEENTYQPAQTLEINNEAFNVYALAGYNIVKNGPYVVNVFLGTSIKTRYKAQYHLQNEGEYTNKNFTYNYTGVMGMSLNVGIIHFDARYQFNFPDTDLSFVSIKDIPEKYHGIYLKKK